jgi:hypothetical protein
VALRTPSWLAVSSTGHSLLRLTSSGVVDAKSEVAGLCVAAGPSASHYLAICLLGLGRGGSAVTTRPVSPGERKGRQDRRTVMRAIREGHRRRRGSRCQVVGGEREPEVWTPGTRRRSETGFPGLLFSQMFSRWTTAS